MIYDSSMIFTGARCSYRRNDRLDDTVPDIGWQLCCHGPSRSDLSLTPAITAFEIRADVRFDFNMYFDSERVYSCGYHDDCTFRLSAAAQATNKERANTKTRRKVSGVTSATYDGRLLTFFKPSNILVTNLSLGRQAVVKLATVLMPTRLSISLINQSGQIQEPRSRRFAHSQ
jgi:hypothetical protein